MPRLLLAGVLVLVVLIAAGAACPAGTVQTRWVITNLDAGSGWWATYAFAINGRGQIIGDGGTKGSDYWHAFVWQNGKMTDLALFPTETMSHAAAINDAGEVVGWSDTKSGVRHAFLWQNGRMRDLGVPGGKQSEAVAINGRGQIVGNSFASALRTAPRAFLWLNGKMTDLGTLGGKSSTAEAINDRGQVVGWSDTKSGVRHAFLWQNGRIRDLGVLGGKQSEAVAINGRGQIVGVSFASAKRRTDPRAFLWQNGRSTELGWVFYDSDDPWTRGEATRYSVAINERGEVAGRLAVGSPVARRAFRWANGHLTYLAVPPGATSSGATAINDRGQIVGMASTPLYRAFLWESGKVTDLGVLPGEEVQAYSPAINERGEIVGYNQAHMDSPHAVLWTQRG